MRCEDQPHVVVVALVAAIPFSRKVEVNLESYGMWLEFRGQVML